MDPVKILSSSTRQAALYSLKSLQKTAEKTAKDLCDKVRSSMELIIENTVDEMEREMRDQEVFKFHTVDGWEPIDEYIDETTEDYPPHSTSHHQVPPPHSTSHHQVPPPHSTFHHQVPSGNCDEQPSSSFDLNALKIEELDLMVVDSMQVDGGDGW